MIKKRILLFVLLAFIFCLTPFNSFADENQSSSNSCSSKQSGKNNNNNCNQQNQSQSQDQTQNNNQNVNITLNQPAPLPQVLSVVRAVQLPSTGTPIVIWGILGSLFPLGVILRRITKK